MSWATQYIQELRAGRTVTFRPYGHSMTPRIRSGQLCTVEPVERALLATGDIVLCVVGTQQYLHFIKAIDGEQLQIGNNHGRINGWIDAAHVFGRLVRVEA